MKLYIAWVEGRVELDKGKIDLPLRKDMEQALLPRHVVDLKQGKSRKHNGGCLSGSKREHALR